MLTIPLRLSIKNSKRFLINMHLSKNYQSKRKNSQKNLGSLLEYLIQLKMKIDSIRNSKVHHFADGTNLLLISKSLKQINKLINHGLFLLVQWLRSNKISLNTSKTKIGPRFTKI